MKYVETLCFHLLHIAVIYQWKMHHRTHARQLLRLSVTED
jgi:hypothetical protein